MDLEKRNKIISNIRELQRYRRRMRKITQVELDEIIDEHQKWTRGLSGQRANLSNCDISGLDMSYANLADGIFVNVNMSSVDLTCTTLNDAKMSGAILKEANLSFANLFFTDLSRADLSGAILRGAFFYRSVLTSCKFKDNKSLQDAIFKDVDLSKICSNVLPLPMACPDTGAFIGWKKCRDRCGNPVIVKLLIPEDAKETIQVDNFEENRFVECAPGIHFFINKQEAIEYNG